MSRQTIVGVLQSIAEYIPQLGRKAEDWLYEAAAKGLISFAEMAELIRFKRDEASIIRSSARLIAQGLATRR